MDEYAKMLENNVKWLEKLIADTDRTLSSLTVWSDLAKDEKDYVAAQFLYGNAKAVLADDHVATVVEQLRSWLSDARGRRSNRVSGLISRRFKLDKSLQMRDVCSALDIAAVALKQKREYEQRYAELQFEIAELNFGAPSTATH